VGMEPDPVRAVVNRLIGAVVRNQSHTEGAEYVSVTSLERKFSERLLDSWSGTRENSLLRLNDLQTSVRNSATLFPAGLCWTGIIVILSLPLGILLPSAKPL
jgi:hypothetical protein